MAESKLTNAFLSKIENLVNALEVKNNIFGRKTFFSFAEKSFQNMISLSKI